VGKPELQVPAHVSRQASILTSVPFSGRRRLHLFGWRRPGADPAVRKDAMADYRYALVLENGEPADPPALNTRFSVWREGDEFVAGAELQRFRILGISQRTDKHGEVAECFDACWSVKPLNQRRALAATSNEGT
jgi:hypothetical protein